MSVVPKLMTAEELLVMPDDGMRHELVRGELTTMAPSGSFHGLIAGRLAGHLWKYVSDHRLGETFTADAGFCLEHDPDTVRAPDIAFVRRERLQRERGFYPGAPDLAIEVISPSDRYSDVTAKVGEYLGAGVRMVIVIDPDRESGTVFTATTTTRLGTDDTIDGGDVVPGWKLPLREIFSL